MGEFESATALACLNRDTGITDDSGAPALTETGCTALQSVQRELDCLLSAWREKLFMLLLSQQSSPLPPKYSWRKWEILNCTSAALIAVNLVWFFF